MTVGSYMSPSMLGPNVMSVGVAIEGWDSSSGCTEQAWSCCSGWSRTRRKNEHVEGSVVRNVQVQQQRLLFVKAPCGSTRRRPESTCWTSLSRKQGATPLRGGQALSPHRLFHVVKQQQADRFSHAGVPAEPRTRRLSVQKAAPSLQLPAGWRAREPDLVEGGCQVPSR